MIEAPLTGVGVKCPPTQSNPGYVHDRRNCVHAQTLVSRYFRQFLHCIPQSDHLHVSQRVLRLYVLVGKYQLNAALTPARALAAGSDLSTYVVPALSTMFTPG